MHCNIGEDKCNVNAVRRTATRYTKAICPGPVTFMGHTGTASMNVNRSESNLCVGEGALRQSLGGVVGARLRDMRMHDDRNRRWNVFH